MTLNETTMQVDKSQLYQINQPWRTWCFDIPQHFMCCNFYVVVKFINESNAGLAHLDFSCKGEYGGQTYRK